MLALLHFFLIILIILASPFKSKSRFEAENAALRHQLMVLRRKMHGRIRLTNSARWFFIQLYRWFPSILNATTIIQPETLSIEPVSARPSRILKIADQNSGFNVRRSWP